MAHTLSVTVALEREKSINCLPSEVAGLPSYLR